MTEAFICDAIRTPVGRYNGGLAAMRVDDLAAHPIKALMQRNANVDWGAVDDVIYGCVNQAGEDNRNVARMAGLLAGLPVEVAGATVNRLCGSGLEAAGHAARAVKLGEADMMIAGGVEGMTRSPYVMGKPEGPFDRAMKLEDTVLGWRFVNPKMKAAYGIDPMGQTAENVATEHQISRTDQDAFAYRSQRRCKAAQDRGFFDKEIVKVCVKKGKTESIVERDEHPRGDTTMEILSKLPAAFREGGSVTAGNSSGINDGACAMIIASEAAAKANGLDAARAHPRHGLRRRAAARHGHRAAAGNQEAFRQARHDDEGFRHRRAQRSLRRPGAGGAAPARPVRRRGEGEPQWRRDRARPSAGRLGRPADDHRAQSARGHRRQARALHHVHRRRPGHRARAGAG